MSGEPAVRPPLRILHVTDSFLPTLGGIELHIADLVARQRSQGHEAHVLTRPPGTTVDEGVVRTGAGPARVMRLAQVLSRAAAYDVVHVHASVYSPLAWRATLTCARQQLPVVFTAHSLLTGVTRPYRIASTVLRLRSLPVVWTAVSETAARSLRDSLALGDRTVHVLPNAVDPGAWRSDTVSQERDVVTFVAVMRLAARKRPHALLQAFEDAAVSPAARLLLVGDGPRASACRRWCRTHPDVSVIMLGQQDRRQIRSVLRQADVFVAPATRESFGIAALEARESGLPVVAHSGTGIGDFLVDGVHGLLVGSDAEMAGAIRTLTVDRPLLRKLSARTQEESAGYDWARATAAAERAYREAVAATGTGSRREQEDRRRRTIHAP